MVTPQLPTPSAVKDCSPEDGLGIHFSMAFQPIVNASSGQVFAYEALVRGASEHSSAQVLANVSAENRYVFDQACRVKSIQLAAEFGMRTFLSMNFFPNAFYEPDCCICATLLEAQNRGFRTSRIIFELTEGEKVEDPVRLRDAVAWYRDQGFWTAIDDFGSGHAGLNLLADFQTDIVKLDMNLIRGINEDLVRQKIVKGIVRVCRELSIEPIAEGIETYEEYQTVRDFGVDLFQGYYFARPQFEALATVSCDLFDGKRRN